MIGAPIPTETPSSSIKGYRHRGDKCVCAGKWDNYVGTFDVLRAKVSTRQTCPAKETRAASVATPRLQMKRSRRKLVVALPVYLQ